MEEVELSYAAGFVDADGSISVVVGGHSKTNVVYYRLLIQVTGRNPIVPRWLASKFGGFVTIDKKNQHGVDRRYYHWSILGSKAAQFLSEIMPYLRIKKEQAELGIEFQGYKRPQIGSRGVGLLNPERQEEIHYRIIDLNRGG